ncbi:MAG: hypothetical protein JXA60_09680 [Candidatus Coatesbacteria bacterium]|nr:hypothetical protein [Candidatus Coatesbacteria bacterium]
MENTLLKLRKWLKEAEENNNWRQFNCINLIPSENTPSPLVKLCEISDPSGRYAEHKTAAKKELSKLENSQCLKDGQIYYYQGVDFIHRVESEVRKEFAAYLECKQVEARPISGQQANEIVFKAICKLSTSTKPISGLPAASNTGRIAKVFNNGLNYGGHLSAQPFGALFNLAEDNVTNIPIRVDNLYKVDVKKLCELIDTERPGLIVFGKSMFLHPEPVKEVKVFVSSIDSYKPIIMYDAAHVMGILGDLFQNPLDDGADIVTGSTHKTFFGPQRGIIASNIEDNDDLSRLWKEINTRSFPGSLSNHHLGTLLGMLIATIEMNGFKKEYQTAVLQNSRSFAKYLKNAGIKVEGGEEDGFTKTHQVIIRISDHADGKEIASRLEANNILTNFQALPDDENFYHPSGIRMGVQEMTRFGMKESDFEVLANLIAEIIIKNKNLKNEIAELRKGFLEMKYTLPLSDSIALREGLMNAVFGK